MAPQLDRALSSPSTYHSTSNPPPPTPNPNATPNGTKTPPLLSSLVPTPQTPTLNLDIHLRLHQTPPNHHLRPLHPRQQTLRRAAAIAPLPPQLRDGDPHGRVEDVRVAHAAARQAARRLPGLPGRGRGPAICVLRRGGELRTLRFPYVSWLSAWLELFGRLGGFPGGETERAGEGGEKTEESRGSRRGDWGRRKTQWLMEAHQ